MHERDLLKRLDERDRVFLRRCDSYLDELLGAAERMLDRRYTMPQIIAAPFPAAGELGSLLTGHSQDVLAIGQAHAAILAAELHRRFAPLQLAQDWQPWFRREVHLASPLAVDPEQFWLDPAAALEALEARENMLAGDVEGTLWQDVKRIMLEHLRHGSRKQTVAAMSELSRVTLRRAELITTTESTYAYNRGRLAGFYAADVDYLQFSAVIDARTSPQCRSRHGKVVRLGSAAMAANTPPLHGRCRSVWSPLFSRYQPEIITPEALDWSQVKPLPKGWKVAG